MWKAALAILVVAACGRDGAITEPVEPNASAMQPGVLALGVDSATGASIETNKDDYSPGEVVHVVGKGWAPGETVNLHMTEEPNTHADVDTNVVADASGGFSIHFYDVQTHDLGVTFKLTATGVTSGSVAVATFTDGQPDTFTITVTQSPNPVTAPGSATYRVRVNYSGTNATCTAIMGAAVTASPAWPAPPVGGFFSFSPSSVVGQGSGGGTAVNPETDLTITVPAGMAPNTYHFTVSATRNPQPGDACQGNGTTTSVSAFDLVVGAANTAPVVGAGVDATINEGDTFLQAGSFTDPDNDTWTATVDYGDGSGVQALALVGKTFSLSHVYTDNGTYNVTVTVNDGTASGSDVVVVTVNNVAPTATFNAPSPVDEGSNISLSLTAPVDPSSDDVAAGFTYEFDCGLGAGYESSLTNTRSCPTTDNGSRTVKGKIMDKDGGFTAYSATITINNVVPNVTITTPALDGALYSLLNGAISVTAGYTDAGINDTHTCRIELNGAMSVAVDYFAVSGGTCTNQILPPEAGVYTLTFKVKDDDGGEGSASRMIVVYDPSAGFVTGGGWIQSDAGFYKPDETLSGKATFGFVSRYKKGANIPEGNTEFQFHAGGMNFHSSTYQWLVVNQAGTNAQFKGTGTINGGGSYTFMLWATDGGNTGDKFRIQITDNSILVGDPTVYDNGVDQVINSGSIVIHTGGKK
jgi:hypothetical protein